MAVSIYIQERSFHPTPIITRNLPFTRPNEANRLAWGMQRIFLVDTRQPIPDNPCAVHSPARRTRHEAARRRFGVVPILRFRLRIVAAGSQALQRRRCGDESEE